MTDGKLLFGRTVIYTDVPFVDESNVIDVLNATVSTHQKNANDIQYLYDYYKGKQPILERKKEQRAEICNRIVENRANEIVSFKVGYLMGEPIQYVNRNGDEKVSDMLNLLNEYVFAEDKASADKEIADWFYICGTAFRMILPDDRGEEDEAPFEIYTLDPRYAYVVYNSGLGNKPVMAVKFIKTQENGLVYSIYTEREYFEVIDNNITRHEYHTLGAIPIIEYPANNARLGSFEIVISLLDAINEIQSNRLDGIEQFIQAFLLLKGVDIDQKDFAELKALGGLKLPADGDAKYLTQELNQTQTQTFVDNLYQTVLTICGMPNRNGGSSTSDTGSAVIMRDGWSDAEARAKDTEMMFKKSEKKFLRIVLNITNTMRDLSLKLSDIEIRFTRRNYENIQEKAQVLTTMLANDKIHPKLAFEHSGMFTDANLAYTESIKYYEDRMKELEKELSDSDEHKEDDV